MKGVVVELIDLKQYAHLNHKRGFIVSVQSETPLKYEVNVENKTYCIKNENLKKVYCLGLPKEFRVINNQMNVKELFLGTIAHIKSSSFYVIPQQIDAYTSIFIINNAFFEMAYEKMATEPLLRIYSTTKSAKDSTSIIFDQCCAHVPTDLSYPWFVDLDANQLMSLISRFESIKDENTLKQLNMNDFHEKYNL